MESRIGVKIESNWKILQWAAEHAAADPLVLKAVLAPTDGAPAHGDAVKLVLALLPRVAAANWRCSLH